MKLEGVALLLAINQGWLLFAQSLFFGTKLGFNRLNPDNTGQNQTVL